MSSVRSWQQGWGGESLGLSKGWGGESLGPSKGGGGERRMGQRGKISAANTNTRSYPPFLGSPCPLSLLNSIYIADMGLRSPISSGVP